MLCISIVSMKNLSFSETTKKKIFPIELSLVKENLLGTIIRLGTEEMAPGVRLLSMRA